MEHAFDHALITTLQRIAQSSEPVTILTGAGISAESGIPTFRGAEGYWTVGSKEYHPQEMATWSMFTHVPYEVWKWYLYRRTICRAAAPNPGHDALVELENFLGDRFTLITQNVDGLHLEAGNSMERTFQIHGNVDYMRCARECSGEIYPIPAELHGITKESSLSPQQESLLRCPRCHGMSRPHILWFDESYDEHHYKFNSSMEVACQTKLLVVVGTSGATNLPNQVANEVWRRGGIIIDVNLEENPFTQLACSGEQGFFIQQPSATALPEIVDIMLSTS